jgi:hypothetical protein
MGIRFLCPSGHKLNVKGFLAGKRAICPQCGAKVIVPEVSEVSEDAISRQDAGVFGLASGSATGPMSETASSVVIDVAESTVTSPALSDSFDSSIPESIVAVTSLPTKVIEPTATDPGIDQELRRARSRRNQMAAAIVLLMVVIVLAGVFIWVLRREAASMKAQETPPAEKEEQKKSTSVERSSRVAFDMHERVFTTSTERG